MVTYSLKRSYRLKDLEEIDFKDLWGNYGIFTTMWIFGKPPKILFFKSHIKNLIKSLQIFGIKKRDFEITMRCLISKVAMAFENNKDKIYGFQFHPESFLTINGNLLIKKILSA